MDRLTILTFVGWYQPGFKAGGPVKSISNLVACLGDEFKFLIITSDRDMGDSVSYPGITPGRWHAVGKAHVCYLSPAMQRLGWIAKIMRDTPHDVVYLNSFFHPHFSTLPLLAQRLHLAPRRTTILAPRGELSVGALALKAAKKCSFRMISKTIGLHTDLIWQASTELEAVDIRRVFKEDKIKIKVTESLMVATDLSQSAEPADQNVTRGEGQALRVVFLSRICPMKNLHFALQVLAQVKVPVEFSIYGPREDAGYWEQCEALIPLLPANISVTYIGPVKPNQVISMLSKHDLFFLPTLGENYGHVITEAIAAGLPLLLSNKTPWCGLEELGIGRDLPLDDMVPFAAYIEDLGRASAEEIAQTKRFVALHLAKISNTSASLAANRSLFTQTAAFVKSSA